MVVIEDDVDNNPNEGEPDDVPDDNPDEETPDDDNNQINGQGGNNNQGELIDNTISRDPIPQTGMRNIVIIICIITGIIVAIVSYIRGKKII